MKDEIIIKCGKCSGTEFISYGDTLQCITCGAAVCGVCGGLLTYIEDMYICTTCTEIYSSCCHYKIREIGSDSLRLTTRCSRCCRRFIPFSIDKNIKKVMGEITH